MAKARIWSITNRTNNNMKTATQELIDLVKEIERQNLILTTQSMLNILESRILSNEKKQIIDAFNEGVKYGNSSLQTFDYPASRYYVFTYKDNKQIKNN